MGNVMELVWETYREVGRGLSDFQGLMTVAGMESTSRVRGSAGKRPPARGEEKVSAFNFSPGLESSEPAAFSWAALERGPNIRILVVYRGCSQGKELESG